MKSALIKISKKIEIFQSTPGNFEQQAFNDSFNEFVEQMRSSPATTWDQLKQMNGGQEPRIIVNISRAVVYSVSNLNNSFPGGFKDFAKKNEILFEDFYLKILETDKNNIANHKIQIYFTFPEMTLIDSFENKILVTLGDKSSQLNSNDTIGETFIIELDSSINIDSYKSI